MDKKVKVVLGVGAAGVLAAGAIIFIVSSHKPDSAPSTAPTNPTIPKNENPERAPLQVMPVPEKPNIPLSRNSEVVKAEKDEKTAKKDDPEYETKTLKLIEEAEKKALELEASSGAEFLYNKIKNELAEIQKLRDSFGAKADAVFQKFDKKLDELTCTEFSDDSEAMGEIFKKFSDFREKFDCKLDKEKDLKEKIASRVSTLYQFARFDFKDCENLLDTVFKPLDELVDKRAEAGHKASSEFEDLLDKNRKELRILSDSNKEEISRKVEEYKKQAKELSDQYKATSKELSEALNAHLASRNQSHEDRSEIYANIQEEHDNKLSGLQDDLDAADELPDQNARKQKMKDINAKITALKEETKNKKQQFRLKRLKDLYDSLKAYEKDYLKQATDLAKLEIQSDSGDYSVDIADIMQLMIESEFNRVLRAKKIQNKLAEFKLRLLNKSQ